MGKDRRHDNTNDYDSDGWRTGESTQRWLKEKVAKDWERQLRDGTWENGDQL